MALSQTSSSRMTCALMGLQPVILESQNAMNAVDGATTERRIRINRPDEGRGRCKGSRVVDLVRGHQADSRVVMILIIPIEEGATERFCVFNAAEALRKLGLIF